MYAIILSTHVYDKQYCVAMIIVQPQPSLLILVAGAPSLLYIRLHIYILLPSTTIYNYYYYSITITITILSLFILILILIVHQYYHSTRLQQHHVCTSITIILSTTAKRNCHVNDDTRRLLATTYDCDFCYLL